MTLSAYLQTGPRGGLTHSASISWSQVINKLIQKEVENITWSKFKFAASDSKIQDQILIYFGELFKKLAVCWKKTKFDCTILNALLLFTWNNLWTIILMFKNAGLQMHDIFIMKIVSKLSFLLG